MIIKDPAVSERYATALLNVAVREGVQQQLHDNAEELLKLFVDGAPMRVFLEAPQIPTDQKEQVVERVFKSRMHPLSYQMLRMLLTKGRIEYLRAIVERFRVLVEREQGIYEAKVASPQLLDEATRKQLQDALEKYTTHRLKITWAEDPSLIGGVRFTYGDTLIDDSVKGKLGKLRQQLEMAAGQR